MSSKTSSSTVPVMTVDEAVPADALRERALTAVYWTALLRTGGRAIGFARNIALARLLSPDDIGVFGIALLVLSVLDRFSNTGLQSALVQKKGSIVEYLNNAFTLQAVRGIGLGVITYLSAPMVVAFFAEPRAQSLIELLALSIVLRGLQNPAIVAFERHLALRRQVVLRFATTATDLLISIVLAILLRSPMALMIGLVGGKAIGLVLSYVLHPYRPKLGFDWRQTRELGGYGRWVFLSNAIWFLAYRGDNLIAGKLLGPAALGVYILAYRISEVVTLEVALMLNDVAFPAYARMQDDLVRVRKTFVLLTELVTSVALPMGTLLALVAVPLTNVILGERWADVGAILPVLAIAGVLRSVVGNVGSALRGVGHPRLAFLHMLCGVCVMYAVMIPLSNRFGLVGIAWACQAGMMGALPVALWQARNVLGLRAHDFARISLPAIALSAAASVGPIAAGSLFADGGDLQLLVASSFLGVLCFAAVAIALWRFWRVGPLYVLSLRHGARRASRATVTGDHLPDQVVVG